MTTTMSHTSTVVISREGTDANASQWGTQLASESRHGRRWPRRGIALALLPLLAAITGLYWYSSGEWFAWWTDIWSTIVSPQHFRAWIQGFGVWAPAVYFAAEVAQVIVPPIPGSIFPPVASAAFGAEAALALTMAGTTIGSAIVFALARKWGRPLLERIVLPATIGKYARILTARGGLWLFVIMLLPFLPDDAVCAMVGSTAISFPRFIILTTLGRLPSTLLGVYLVAGPAASPATLWLPAALIVLVPFALGIGYRDRLETWLLRRTDEM